LPSLRDNEQSLWQACQLALFLRITCRSTFWIICSYLSVLIVFSISKLTWSS